MAPANTIKRRKKNNKKVKTIKGLKFKQAAFGIWLCDDPADKDLKEGMLKG